jgi:hypothetical protein
MASATKVRCYNGSRLSTSSELIKNMKGKNVTYRIKSDITNDSVPLAFNCLEAEQKTQRPETLYMEHF